MASKKNDTATAKPAAARKQPAAKLPPNPWSEELWQGQPQLCCGFCGYSTLEGEKVIEAHVRQNHANRLISVKEA